MKLIILGTGNAQAVKCYNTCFALDDEGKYFLVDAGGGNTILSRLEEAQIDIHNIHEMFVTHKHIDHLLGVIWILRIVGQEMNKGKYEGDFRLYAHEEVIGLLTDMAEKLIARKQAQFIGNRIQLITVEDGESRTVNGRETVFFDIHSTKARQFGFMMAMDHGEMLTCCGDEPFEEHAEKYARGSRYLLHEAFCLYRDRDIFKPYEKAHSTVKEAAENAERLGVKNLVLYHTEDKHLSQRKALYTSEAASYYHGGIYVPDDLDVIDLDK